MTLTSESLKALDAVDFGSKFFKTLKLWVLYSNLIRSFDSWVWDPDSFRAKADNANYEV